MEEMSNEERLEEETPLQTIEEDTKGGEETAEAIVPDLGDQETELNEVAAEELPQTPDPVEDVDEEDVHEDIVDEILVIPTDTDAEMEAEAEIDPVQLDSPDTPDESLGESEGELIDTAAISAPEPVFGFDVEQTDGEFIPLAEDSLSEESETEQTEEELAKIDDDRQWYVVHCYSGYENKVRHNLEQRIETMGMKNKIFDVVVPTEEEMEVRDGKRRTVERRVFPGYILVQMLMNEDSWYVVRNTPGVTGFVGMGNDPTPLRPEEVSQIIRRMEAEAPRIKVTYVIGQKVRIIDGPFNDFIGTVDNIDVERAKVRVMVSFFGRETPVELDFLQVEKA